MAWEQGDPLSPFCVEGFSGLINRSVLAGGLGWTSNGTEAPVVSHNFFMDDCLLFIKDKPDSVGTLLDVLQQYEQASGTED